jgi:hypothetical protein
MNDHRAPRHGTDEPHLTRLFRALDEDDRRTLLAFAEFLAAGRQPAAAPAPPVAPTPLPRPEQETVIAAIRRLSRTYTMLDRGPMLNETSALMSAHVLQGRDAAIVIDDLEALFLRHFEDYRARLPAASGEVQDGRTGTDTPAAGPD